MAACLVLDLNEDDELDFAHDELDFADKDDFADGGRGGGASVLLELFTVDPDDPVVSWKLSRLGKLADLRRPTFNLLLAFSSAASPCSDRLRSKMLVRFF